MKKQTNSFKFILLFFFCSFVLSKEAFTAEKNEKLISADSLFNQKKYTESFLLYESLLNEDKYSSPRMYLRMAFIKEGLGNYSEALFYLNSYFLQTSNKNVQGKMKEIANEHNLSGFEINDRTFFARQLRSYYSEILIVLFSITAIIFITLLYFKIKKGKRLYPLAFVLIGLLFASYYLLNFGKISDEGIVVTNHAYIMSGPSSGSDLIEVIQNGHKVKIIEDNSEIWTAIEWNGNKCFLRKSKLKKFI